MFSGLTSLLWGSSAPEEDAAVMETTTAATNLKTVPADTDDWVLVDKSRGNSPHRLEASSLENLLIEHPSMSVYGKRHRQSSTGDDSGLSTSSTSSGVEQDRAGAGSAHHRNMASAHAPRRPRAVAVRAGIMTQVTHAHKHQTRAASRTALDRRNKLVAAQASAKRFRSRGAVKQPAARSFNKRC